MKTKLAAAIEQATVGFCAATRDEDPIEAAEYALELLRCRTRSAFSAEATVEVAREGEGLATLIVADRNGRYGPKNERLQRLAAELGEDVLLCVPVGRFTVA